MKQPYARLLVYLSIFCFFTLITDSWYECGNIPTRDCAVQSVGYYGFGLLFYGFFYECVYRLAKWERHRHQPEAIADAPTKELPVPETNRLDTTPKI